jgi:hypothetical protein
MGRLKSLFLGTFIALLSVSLLHACLALHLHGLAIGWLGVVVSAMSNLAFLYWMDARDSARSWSHFRLLVVLSAAGALFSLWGALRPVPDIHRLPFWYAFTVLAGTALYAFWYIRTGEAVDRLSLAGQRFQFLAGIDDVGMTVVHHTAGGKASQMLIIRSNLCPYCVAAQVLYLDDQRDRGTRPAARSRREKPATDAVENNARVEDHTR